ncbi:hypothetical protein CDN99_06630 [Roseateles aquatilis]|uniref:Major capsid protein n=1 Tax=Roseateles aquatilis TaxID=431061 RepID=A0A246JH90_9BURK|nr:phage capsid protein [Roseateles aquatilis]OWQ92028.1 hypothetical protein CDN99_06630 [Roseateles aquatilis]
MSTSPTITTANRIQFHDSFFLKLQQKVSRFQGRVTDRGMISGSLFTTNNIGQVEAQQVNGRYQDKQAQDIDHETRLCYLSDFDVGPLVVDAFDLPKLVADPTYKYMDLLIAATNRRKDRTIYRALLDGALSRNAEGATPTLAIIPAGQQIAAGGTGFTKAKLIQSKALFRGNEADEFNDEELSIAYDSVMLRQLLSDTTLTSADFMAVKMLQEGKLADKWLGYNWIPYNALDVPAANTSRTVAWAKSGLQYGTGIDVKTDISENKTKRGNPTEVYGWMSLGAVRQDDQKVVQIDFANNV